MLRAEKTVYQSLISNWTLLVTIEKWIDAKMKQINYGEIVGGSIRGVLLLPIKQLLRSKCVTYML